MTVVSLFHLLKRFRHPRYWAGYCLLGNDPKVDLKQIKTAVLDKHLTQMEQTVLKNLPKDVLNEPPKSDQGIHLKLTTTYLCFCKKIVSNFANQECLCMYADITAFLTFNVLLYNCYM